MGRAEEGLKAEVAQAYLTGRVIEKHVVGVEAAVHDFAGRRKVESGGDLCADRQRPLQRPGPFALQNLTKRAPLDGLQ